MQISEKELQKYIDLGGTIELKFIEIDGSPRKFHCYVRLAGEDTEKQIWTVRQDARPKTFQAKGMYALIKRLDLKKCTMIFT